MSLSVEIISFLLIGAMTGLGSGLLGIGGGIIVVPSLAFMFAYLSHIPGIQTMHMAIGTSFSVMIVTAIVATISRHRRGHVKWRLALGFVPGILLGVIAGGLVTNLLPTRTLEIIFGVVLILVAIRLFFFSGVVQAEKRLPIWAWFLFSVFVGFAAGLLGIGGGVLVIPFLAYCGLSMPKASGTASSITLPIAVVGTIMFALTGGLNEMPVLYSTGFIYWPAFAGVAVGAAIFAPVGVAIATRVNTGMLKKIFAIVMVVVAAQLLIGH